MKAPSLAALLRGGLPGGHDGDEPDSAVVVHRSLTVHGEPDGDEGDEGDASEIADQLAELLDVPEDKREKFAHLMSAYHEACARESSSSDSDEDDSDKDDEDEQGY